MEEDQRLEGPDKAKLTNEDDHLRIADVLKGHPLAMLMLVKFAHARPKEINRLLGDLGQENGYFEAEGGRLIEALKREYWLVEPDAHGFDLRHRPALRRMMLWGIFALPRADESPS